MVQLNSEPLSAQFSLTLQLLSDACLSRKQAWLNRNLLRSFQIGSAMSMQDLSDAQWRNFRGSAHILIAAALGTTLLGALFRDRPQARTLYWLVVGVAFNFQLHGA